MPFFSNISNSHKLYRLVLAFIVPLLLVLFIAWHVYWQFDKIMSDNAEQYLKNLADSVAVRFQTHLIRTPFKQYVMLSFDRNGIKKIAEILSDLNLPGIFAVYRSDGELVYTSYDLDFIQKIIAKLSKNDINRTVRIKTDDGQYYSAMLYPFEDNQLYMVAAVPWNMLFRSMTSLLKIWPFIISSLAIALCFAVYFLCVDVIMPLHAFNKEASTLRLGFELPSLTKKSSVPEIQHLRENFCLIAQTAIDKEQLSRDYITDIVRVLEEERERISREIHDGPLQEVTALVQQMRMIALETNDDKIIHAADKASKVALDSVKELRQICNALTPPWIDLGIYGAIAELCTHNSHSNDVQIDFEGNFMDFEDNEISAATCLACYRVAQEAINNSAVHGHANKITISLSRDDNTIYLKIQDNGTGFEVPENIKELRVHGHRGLSNMKERMLLVGGKINISSNSINGTEITCEVPIKNVQ